MSRETTGDRLRLTGRTAVVTGGSRGIGAAIVLAIAEAGAKSVFVLSRKPEEKGKLREAVEAAGAAYFPVSVDLSSPEDIDTAAKKVLGQEKKVDILVNNAGVADLAPLEDLTVEQFDNTMAINVRAPLLLAQKFAPAMKEAHSGKIVNISSQGSLRALPDHGVYCPSKSALNMLTQVMTVEWSPFNIQVNCVAPTIILTDMGRKVWGSEEKGGPMKARIPLGRFGTPEEVADSVVFLASSASDLITGQVVTLDGGFTAA